LRQGDPIGDERGGIAGDHRLERLIDRLPRFLRSSVRWLRQPSLIWLRIPAGILLIVGIASALWTASGYVGAFMRASNVIYEVEEGRSIIKLRPLQMLVTLVLVVLLALVLAALVLTGPIASAVGSAVGLGGAAVTAWNIAKWPVLFLVVVFMITTLYWASPNAKLGGLKTTLPGSALAMYSYDRP
jgi:membrane protein